MGKQDYKFSDRTSLGQLPKEVRKVINKTVDKTLKSSFDHTAVCTGEIGAVVACFEANGFEASACLPQISAMHDCIDLHKDDPDPKVLARQWQKSMQQRVLQSFAKARVIGRR